MVRKLDEKTPGRAARKLGPKDRQRPEKRAQRKPGPVSSEPPTPSSPRELRAMPKIGFRSTLNEILKLSRKTEAAICSRLTRAEQAEAALASRINDIKARIEHWLGYPSSNALEGHISRLISQVTSQTEWRGLIHERLWNAQPTPDAATPTTGNVTTLIESLIADRAKSNELIARLAFNLSRGDEQEQIETAGIDAQRAVVEREAFKLAELSLLSEMAKGAPPKDPQKAVQALEAHLGRLTLAGDLPRNVWAGLCRVHSTVIALLKAWPESGDGAPACDDRAQAADDRAQDAAIDAGGGFRGTVDEAIAAADHIAPEHIVADEIAAPFGVVFKPSNSIWWSTNHTLPFAEARELQSALIARGLAAALFANADKTAWIHISVAPTEAADERAQDTAAIDAGGGFCGTGDETITAADRERLGVAIKLAASFGVAFEMEAPPSPPNWWKTNRALSFDDASALCRLLIGRGLLATTTATDGRTLWVHINLDPAGRLTP